MIISQPKISSERLVDRSHLASSNRFEGFDFLRAIFAVVVVILHAKLLLVLTGKLQLGFLADILNANVGYLAVPVFLQISLFLFLIKSEKAGSQYFQKQRLPKLISLYLFWSLAKLLFDAVLLGDSPAIKHGLSSIGNFIGFLIGGGYSAFYFFFSLLFLTVIAELFMQRLVKVKSPLAIRRMSYYLLLASCCLVSLFPVFDAGIGDRETFTQIVNPLNFLPYLFTAVIVWQELKHGELAKPTKTIHVRLYGLLALFLAFTIFEWAWFDKFPHYSRLSLVFGSWLLLYLALLSNQKPPVSIRLLSNCSLGIYVFHVFFVDHTSFLESLSNLIPGLGLLTKFLIALVGSIGLTLVFRKNNFLRLLV